MKYYEKGHTYHGVKMPGTVVITDFEDKVIMVIATIIVLFPFIAILALFMLVALTP
jgi:hypothetical protein